MRAFRRDSGHMEEDVGDRRVQLQADYARSALTAARAQRKSQYHATTRARSVAISPTVVMHARTDKYRGSLSLHHNVTAAIIGCWAGLGWGGDRQ